MLEKTAILNIKVKPITQNTKKNVFKHKLDLYSRVSECILYLDCLKKCQITTEMLAFSKSNFTQTTGLEIYKL